MEDFTIIARGLAYLGAIVAVTLSLVNTVYGFCTHDRSRIPASASWLLLAAGLTVIVFATGRH